MALHRNNESSRRTNSGENVRAGPVLDRAHRSIGRAAFLLAVMLVKKAYWRNYAVEALHCIRDAEKELAKLTGET